MTCLRSSDVSANPIGTLKGVLVKNMDLSVPLVVASVRELAVPMHKSLILTFMMMNSLDTLSSNTDHAVD